MSNLEILLHKAENLREEIRSHYQETEEPWTDPLWNALTHAEDLHHWLQEAITQPLSLKETNHG